jgi:hypothetical protein
MRRPAPQLFDASMYVQAVPLLFRHPSIFIAPLLGVVAWLLLSRLGQVMTDPLGGLGLGLYDLIGQLGCLFAFGVAVIQASFIWRGRDGSLAAAWHEAQPKAGGIILAAVGFTFILYAARYIGQVFGAIGLVLEPIAAIFMIYTIPAAAIGGMPGQFALSASIRGVRNQPVGALVLGLVFILLWILASAYGTGLLAPYVPANLIPLVMGLFQTLVLGYLAFPFAKQFEEVAFRGF